MTKRQRTDQLTREIVEAQGSESEEKPEPKLIDLDKGALKAANSNDEAVKGRKILKIKRNPDLVKKVQENMPNATAGDKGTFKLFGNALPPAEIKPSLADLSKKDDKTEEKPAFTFNFKPKEGESGSLFGNFKPSGSLFGDTKPTGGSLFGAGSSLFGTGKSIFDKKPESPEKETKYTEEEVETTELPTEIIKTKDVFEKKFDKHVNKFKLAHPEAKK